MHSELVELEMEGATVGIKEAEDEWKVVRPRKGQPHAKRHSHKSAGEGHGSCCPGHGRNSNLSSGDADEEPRMRVRLQKSMERVRSSVFFVKLVEQMQDLQILEKLLASASGAGVLHVDQTVLKAAVPSVGPISVDHEASTLQFSDSTCGDQTLLCPSCFGLLNFGFRVLGLRMKKSRNYLEGAGRQTDSL